MKYIKQHIMFIFPLLAILLGIETFIIFDRLTQNYENGLKADYNILVSCRSEMTLDKFQDIDRHISKIEPIDKQTIVDDMAKSMDGVSSQEIMKSLPNFYTVSLDSFLDNDAIIEIKSKLLDNEHIKKVETFGKSHNSNYNMFVFIKTVLWTFVIFIFISSLLLTIKQMEIWQYLHKDRMNIMETFGATLMMRSGILFKRAIVDALVATALASLFFLLLRFSWAKSIKVEGMPTDGNLIFNYQDALILTVSSLSIVALAVIIVVSSAKED